MILALVVSSFSDDLTDQISETGLNGDGVERELLETQEAISQHRAALEDFRQHVNALGDGPKQELAMQLSATQMERHVRKTG